MNGSTVNLPELFESEWNSTEAQFKDGEKEQMLERGSALMAMFAEQFADIKPQSVEKSFRLPLISPSGVFLQRDIVGVMDCIADDTIIEYKTSAKSSSQKDADESIQLTLYSWAYRMVFGKPEKAVKLVVLVRTRNPKIQVFETQRSEDDYMGRSVSYLTSYALSISRCSTVTSRVTPATPVSTGNRATGGLTIAACNASVASAPCIFWGYFAYIASSICLRCRFVCLRHYVYQKLVYQYLVYQKLVYQILVY